MKAEPSRTQRIGQYAWSVVLVLAALSAISIMIWDTQTYLQGIKYLLSPGYRAELRKEASERRERVAAYKAWVDRAKSKPTFRLALIHDDGIDPKRGDVGAPERYVVRLQPLWIDDTGRLMDISACALSYPWNSPHRTPIEFQSYKVPDTSLDLPSAQQSLMVKHGIELMALRRDQLRESGVSRTSMEVVELAALEEALKYPPVMRYTRADGRVRRLSFDDQYVFLVLPIPTTEEIQSGKKEAEEHRASFNKLVRRHSNAQNPRKD